MKLNFVQVILSLFLLLLVLLILAVESSSSLSDTSVVTNITRGSSLSASSNASGYWLSPSGNIAFGFYLLPCRHSHCTDRYVVGIWLVKSPQKTLVWTANRDDDPLSKPSSIVLTDEGRLVLKIKPDGESKLLIPGIEEPVSYAMMHDNGNFVLYGSMKSQVVWQSFDHPTDTILGGQKLRDGVDLVSRVSLFNPGSGTCRLSIRQSDGMVATYCMSTHPPDTLLINTVVSLGFKDPVDSPVTLNLDTTGKLYLVGSNGVVLRYIYPNTTEQQKERQENDDKENHYIYRAIVDATGQTSFNLYKERIDGNASDNEKSSTLLSSYKFTTSARDDLEFWLIFLGVCGTLLLAMVIIFLICKLKN